MPIALDFNDSSDEDAKDKEIKENSKDENKEEKDNNETEKGNTEEIRPEIQINPKEIESVRNYFYTKMPYISYLPISNESFIPLSKFSLSSLKNSKIFNNIL